MLAVVSAFPLVLPKLQCKLSAGLPLVKPLLSKPTRLVLSPVECLPLFTYGDERSTWIENSACKNL